MTAALTVVTPHSSTDPDAPDPQRMRMLHNLGPIEIIIEGSRENEENVELQVHVQSIRFPGMQE